MAFKAVSAAKLAEKRFGWKCEFWEADENGRQSLQTFRAVYIKGDADDDDAALKDWQERLAAAGGDTAKAGTTYDEGWLDRHLVDLKDVVDEDNQPMDFDDAKAIIAKYEPARMAVIQGYHTALSGRKKNA